jgi:hypothetical protein
MLNPGTLAPEVRQAAIANLKEIAVYGRKRNVFPQMSAPTAL